MPFGAEVREDGSVRFRLWAPKAKRVDLCLERRPLPLDRLDDGWYELITREARAGGRYKFQIDGRIEVADPASRFQPEDVHGPSEVVDPRAFAWIDDEWHGRPWKEAVIYELHVGTFSPEGTFRAVEAKLDYLRDLGVTAVELMPVADFAGRRGWGYDGVLLFAPESSYGRPEDLKYLVQAAHSKGLMIFVDVVFNHFGPDGNYLLEYAPQFLTDRHGTPWGDGINFDGPESRTVRDFFIHNALYWIEEFHFDGLRLDAVHAIADDSKPDILTELASTVRKALGEDREVHLILENGDNASHYLARGPEQRIQLYDAQWNDDIHHAMHVLITGELDGYYSDYVHPVRQVTRCLTEGFAYQGEFSAYDNEKRGESTAGLPLTAFISFLQNHDQIGNRALGGRIVQLASPQALKAAMEILLLAPAPPLLFMGEEFGATTPFLYFCDFSGDLAAAVTNGRRNEFARFAQFSSPEQRERIPDPNAEQTFEISKLDWNCLSKNVHKNWLIFYRELLSIRQREIVPRLCGMTFIRTESCEGQRRLAVDWACPGGSSLQLRANVGQEPQTIPSAGTPFYASSREAAAALKNSTLPAWSVIWSVEKSLRSSTGRLS